MSQVIRHAVKLAGVVALLALGWLVWKVPAVQNLATPQHLVTLRDQVGAAWWGPVIFVASYALLAALNFSGLVLTVRAGNGPDAIRALWHGLTFHLDIAAEFDGTRGVRTRIPRLAEWNDASEEPASACHGAIVLDRDHEPADVLLQPGVLTLGNLLG